MKAVIDISGNNCYNKKSYIGVQNERKIIKKILASSSNF